LAHVASDQMQGRKFFYFGTGVGGQQWMDFLSQPGKGDYVEIQSGIAPTQNQRFALPAHSEVHWTEAYAGVQVDPQLAQHKDYQAATQAVGQVIETRFDAESCADVDAFLRGVSSQLVAERLHAGSAWGMRQEQLTGQPLAPGLDFEMRSAVPAKDAWDELLQNGMFIAASLDEVPHTWAIATRWCAALQHSAELHGTTWLHALALGMAAQNQGEVQQARAWYERSLAIKPTWLAYRQSALIASHDESRETAYMQAWRQPGAPDALAVEIMRVLLDSGRLDAARVFLAALPTSARAQERIHLSAAQLAAHAHDWALLEQLLEHPFATVREGETLLDSLWTTLQQGLCHAHWAGQWTEAHWLAWQVEHPVPTRLNFRMQAAVAQPVTTSSSGVLPHGQR
jgi:thioredoxin-like negative regulator of GroEL